jgi:hypothetical protein
MSHKTFKLTDQIISNATGYYKDINIMKLLMSHKDFKLTEKVINSVLRSKDIDIIKLFTSHKDFKLTEKVINSAIWGKDLSVIKLFTSHKDFKLTEKIINGAIFSNNLEVIDYFCTFDKFELTYQHILYAVSRKLEKSAKWCLDHYNKKLDTDIVDILNDNLDLNIVKLVKEHTKKHGYKLDSLNKVGVSNFKIDVPHNDILNFLSSIRMNISDQSINNEESNNKDIIGDSNSILETE